MLRRLLLLSPLALTACQRKLCAQDVGVRGLIPPLSFTMTDVNTGKRVTAADFKGSVVLLYFGYTNCPDVCPATLYNMQRVQAAMGSKAAARVKILFVTVDPNRDTPPLLTQYTALFGANVVGLRGTPNQLYSLARRYRVVFSVVKKPIYTVTHSAAVYVFNAKGKPEFIIAGLSTVKPDIRGIARDLRQVASE
ncbi:SCO family protein [Acidocella sp.]|uniref:SCO family protein n=1 Tax=Acidocella sp. TaxID=50710 RepID=UPI00260AB0B2|nr:SCO family protein [Acidocella sp.]